MTMFTCSACWHASHIKLWRCPQCGEFGSFVSSQRSSMPSLISTSDPLKLYPLHHSEFERVYPWWLRSSWVYLIAGEPGIGKSTIVLMIISQLITHHQVSALYFSAEETTAQIQARVDRVGSMDSLTIFYATNIEQILDTALDHPAQIVILDSIQMIESSSVQSSSWSPTQVKTVSEIFTHRCKQNNRIGIIIWHVTKSGEIAWPRYLEHIVDVVSYLEWDRIGDLRFLRNRKNRYGSAQESAIFTMTQQWLIWASWLSQESLVSLWSPWNVLTIGIDTTRPLLIGIEVLLNKTKISYPKRSTSWWINTRLEMIVAILEKHCKINLSEYDIFVNIPWEMKFIDHGLDLAICAGIIWQYERKSIDPTQVLLGEVWLWWQVLPTAYAQKRINEIWNNLTIVDHTTLRNVKNILERLS